MTRIRSNYLAVLAIVLSPTMASADIITFDDATLGNAGAGFSYVVGGLTMDVAASNGGTLATIASGTFAGLHIPGFGGVESGTYTFLFSSVISSIEIEFDALSSTADGAPERITNFMNSSGAISIAYTNQNGTLFDGSTITSATNDGQGIINYSGGGFNSFSFDHTQYFRQNGFVIERIVVNTAGGVDEVAVPEPGTLALLGIGLFGMGLARRRKKV